MFEPHRYPPNSSRRKAADFIALLQHGWDVYCAMAAVEKEYSKSFSLQYALQKSASIREGFVKELPLPKWAQPESEYRERAAELKQFWRQKMIEEKQRAAEKTVESRDEFLVTLRQKVERTRGREREKALEEMNAYTRKKYLEDHPKH